jgi:hypothetical protein
MSKPIAADVFVVTTGGPELHAGSVDPSAGGGVAAPLGSIYFRTNGTWWRKVAAANTGWVLDSTSLADFVYTATGAEGSSFDVVIPAPFTPLPNTNYTIEYVLEDVTNHVTISFPVTGGLRTTTQFRVVTSGNLTLNDTIRFILIPTA